MPTASSGFSSGCTPKRNSPARVSAWPPCNGSSIATGDGPGPKAPPIKGRLFTLACPLMKVSEATYDHCRISDPGIILAGDESNATETGADVSEPLKVLIVEDSENDATLLE